MKKWLITGATSGIGREMVEKLLEQGDQVFATIRKTGALDELKEKYPNALLVANMEITDRFQIDQVIRDAFARMGTIDVIVSNAGYGVLGAAEEFEDEVILQLIETNLTGSIRLIRAVLPYLRKQGGGHIIQVSSEGGQVAYPGFSIYHASKWGIEGFIESVAQEVEPFNIQLTIAEPGPTSTNFVANLKMSQLLPDYVNTPAHQVRVKVETNDFSGPEELDTKENVAKAIIDCARSKNPAFRLPIGDLAFRNVEQALEKRLNEVKNQKRHI